MADLLSTIVSPWSSPAAWDTLQIGSISWYGKFDIRGAARKYSWNIAAGWGFQGAFETFQAQPPAEFSITFYIWADEQYSTYVQLLDALMYSPAHLPPNNSTNTSALTLVHPQLQNNRITQAVVKSVGDLQKQSDDLMFSVTVDFYEFVPQRAFPPQSPDTGAEANDPNTNPVISDLLRRGKDTQSQIDAALANTGTSGGLP